MAFSELFLLLQVMHAHYVIRVLHEARNILQEFPNIRCANTSTSKQITVCGDLHGKLDDLLIIFYKVHDTFIEY